MIIDRLRKVSTGNAPDGKGLRAAHTNARAACSHRYCRGMPPLRAEQRSDDLGDRRSIC
jgi:hypothetical protein